jgi:hypothetical protein
MLYYYLLCLCYLFYSVIVYMFLLTCVFLLCFFVSFLILVCVFLPACLFLLSVGFVLLSVAYFVWCFEYRVVGLYDAVVHV